MKLAADRCEHYFFQYLTIRRLQFVNIDERKLRNNTYAHGKILEDIQSYSFPPNSFGLIIC